MTFGEKLKKLRTDKELTQEELAEILYVSRTAISKWESGRGFPNIESLKAIAKFFGVTVDALLSGEELITLVEQEQNRKEMQVRDMLFGLLDCSMVLLLFLPFFAQKMDGIIQEVSLLALTEIQPYLKFLYFAVVFGNIIFGLITLILLNKTHKVWSWRKIMVSLVFSTLGVAIFIISRQPYSAVFVFVFLIIKALMLIKHK